MNWGKAIKAAVNGYNYTQNKVSGPEFLNSVADFLSTIEPTETHDQTSDEEKNNLDNYNDEEAADGTDESLICVICKVNKRNVILQPCTHTSTCIECTKAILSSENQLCPICRAEIKHVLAYYRS